MYYSNPVAEFHYEKPKKKLYECDNCGETFKLKAELVKHIKTHRKKPLDQPKPKPTFKCHHCPEVYSDEEKLFDHIDSDHVKKTYKCRFCSYTTLRSYCMKSHQLVHSNYRPFKCVKCDKGFKSQYCLNRHEAIVHSDKPQMHRMPQPIQKYHRLQKTYGNSWKKRNLSLRTLLGSFQNYYLVENTYGQETHLQTSTTFRYNNREFTRVLQSHLSDSTVSFSVFD